MSKEKTPLQLLRILVEKNHGSAFYKKDTYEIETDEKTYTLGLPRDFIKYQRHSKEGYKLGALSNNKDKRGTFGCFRPIIALYLPYGDGFRVKIKTMNGHRYGVKSIITSNPHQRQQVYKEQKYSQLGDLHAYEVVQVDDMNRTFLPMRAYGQENLHDYLKKVRAGQQTLSFTKSDVLTRSLIMAYECQLGFTQLYHRDLKTENIQIIDDEQGNIIGVKIIDFGLSNHKDNEQDSIRGSAVYLPRELILNKARHSLKTEYYSLGLILSEIWGAIIDDSGTYNEWIYFLRSYPKYEYPSDKLFAGVDWGELDSTAIDIVQFNIRDIIYYLTRKEDQLRSFYLAKEIALNLTREQQSDNTHPIAASSTSSSSSYATMQHSPAASSTLTPIAPLSECGRGKSSDYNFKLYNGISAANLLRAIRENNINDFEKNLSKSDLENVNIPAHLRLAVSRGEKSLVHMLLYAFLLQEGRLEDAKHVKAAVAIDCLNVRDVLMTQLKSAVRDRDVIAIKSIENRFFKMGEVRQADCATEKHLIICDGIKFNVRMNHTSLQSTPVIAASSSSNF